MPEYIKETIKDKTYLQIAKKIFNKKAIFF